MNASAFTRYVLARRPVLTAMQVGVGIVIILIWQGLISFHIVGSYELSTPWQVVSQIGSWLAHGVPASETEANQSLWIDIGATLEVAALGLAFALLLGTAVGLLAGILPIAKYFFSPFLGFFNAVPLLILIPCLVFWLGFGNLPVVLLVAITQLFLIAAVVEGAAREIQGVLIQHARALGATWPQMVRTVYLPGVAIWIVSVLRQSVGHAIVGAIVFEFFGANAGLGFLIHTEQINNLPRGIYAGVLVASLVACVFDFGLRMVDKRVGRYLPQQ